jgi:hypothetical protein
VSHNDLWLHRSFRAEHFEYSHVENGVRMQKLWPVEVCCRKPSKTDETVQFGLKSDWTSRNGSTRLGCGFDFFFPLDWRPKPNSRTLKKAWMKTGGTNKNVCEGGGGSIWRGGGSIWWSSGASVRRRDYGDLNSKL